MFGLDWIHNRKSFKLLLSSCIVSVIITVIRTAFPQEPFGLLLLFKGLVIQWGSTLNFKIASRTLPWFSRCLFTTISNRNLGFPTLVLFETLFPYHTVFFTAPDNRIPFYFLPFAKINLLIKPLKINLSLKGQIQCIIDSTECLGWRISNYRLGSPLEISSSSCFLLFCFFFFNCSVTLDLLTRLYQIYYCWYCFSVCMNIVYQFHSI